MRERFFVFAVVALLFVSCGLSSGLYGDGSSFSGEIGDTCNGIVTFYDGYDEDGVAYYAPEIEDG